MTQRFFRAASAGSAPTVDRWAFSFLGTVFACRLLYAHFLGLIPDETYYWDWSRQLAFGYFDHPPVIAWIIFLTRHVFGESTLGVRSGVIACSLLASVVSYLIARKYLDRPSSLVFFLVLSNSILLFGVGTLLATPDIPLILFWTCSLFFGYKALFEDSTASWFALGFCAGMGLMSKYTFALFFIAFALFLLVSKPQRRWFCTWQPYCAMLVALAVWLPNLVWNSHHHWISFAFQFSHGINSAGSLRFDSLGEFIAGQLGVLSIFPFVLLLCAASVSFKEFRTDGRSAYLTFFFLIPFCIFLVASLQKKVEANWAAAAYVSGLIMIARYWDSLAGTGKKGMKRFAIFSTAFAAVTTAAVLVHLQMPYLPLAPANDPANQARGWKKWAQDVDSIRSNLDRDRSLPVCTNRYQEASMLGFYLPDHPKTYAFCLGARENNYVLFQERKPTAFQRIIFIHPSGDPVAGPLYSNTFLSIDRQETATLHQGPTCATPYNVYTAVMRRSL
jgi:4-amino-4-deoxy-L-arabinose transferase-like glycosyltransferase